MEGVIEIETDRILGYVDPDEWNRFLSGANLSVDQFFMHIPRDSQCDVLVEFPLDGKELIDHPPRKRH